MTVSWKFFNISTLAICVLSHKFVLDFKTLQSKLCQMSTLNTRQTVSDSKFAVNDVIFPAGSWPTIVGSLFRNFGDCIKSISLNEFGAIDAYNVMPISSDLAKHFNCFSNFIAKYCTNLDELTLRMDLMDHPVKRFRHTFIGLKFLKINPGKRSIEMVKAINSCRKLSLLHLGWIPFRSTDEILHLFKANRQMKELKILPRSESTTKILHMIGDFWAWKNLKSITWTILGIILI